MENLANRTKLTELNRWLFQRGCKRQTVISHVKSNSEAPVCQMSWMAETSESDVDDTDESFSF